MTSEYCESCGAPLSGSDSFCGRCGAATGDAGAARESRPPVPEAPTAAYATSQQEIAVVMTSVPQRFASLRTIARIFTALAWLVVGLGSIGVLIALLRSGEADAGERMGVALLVAIYVALWSLTLFAAAAFIRLMLGVEENTRLTAELLSRGRES